ncbi:MAG: CoA pyrophosphatase [Halodesulfurarchaeum sp.]
MDLGPLRDRDPTVISDADRTAAVLVPISERSSSPELVFIERAPTLAEHAGEMSFPGGGTEPFDRNRRETAIRESGEEIGLRPEEIEFVGRLDDVRTATGYAVSPFVARVPPRRYDPGDGEVADVVSLSIGGFLAAENHAFEPREYPEYGVVPVHHFRVEGYTIWGATARILVQLLALAAGWTPPEPPGRPLGERLAE